VEVLTLVAHPSAVAPGRAYCAATLRAWGYDRSDFISDAELVFSELVTNAVEAVAPPDASGVASRLLDPASRLKVTLIAVCGCLSIEVWDGVPTAPYPREAVSEECERGRGLRIVACLSRHWGYRYPSTGGKVVFAILCLD
jgi:hypothetical protein